MMRRCLALSLLIGSIASAQTLVDPNLKVQTWVRGLDQPTGVAFVDNGATALVLEKSSGKVQIVKSRAITGTALDLPVANDSERGLLGIALAPDFGVSSSFVYLSYTASTADGGAAFDNRVERYRWNGSKLTFDRKVLVRPAQPGPNHNGGKIAFGPDNKLYAIAGDLNRDQATENFENSREVNAAAVILRVNPSGSSVPANPFYTGTHGPIDDIYAYGIRNSFGLAFDPVTGGLWDTENGPDRMDEINRITPGFNSGWQDIMGPTSRNGGTTGKLVSLGAAAHYEDPKFAWATPVAPTDAYFMETSKLGGAYTHDLFVGTVLDGGVIFDINLTRTRKSLSLSGPLADGVADNSSGGLLAEQSAIVFGTGFGVVTDFQAGPGGMYVTSLSNGVLYRIIADPSGSLPPLPPVTPVPEPGAFSLALMGSIVLLRRRRARHHHTPATGKGVEE
jgi:glucose/arabinose dehydrogenase